MGKDDCWTCCTKQEDPMPQPPAVCYDICYDKKPNCGTGGGVSSAWVHSDGRLTGDCSSPRSRTNVGLAVTSSNQPENK
jgi:hypothetical protein